MRFFEQAAIIVHMPHELLALFPLQAVLFPRTALPLHIFEDRYKEMMQEVLRGSREFGVVQAGEKGIVDTGCTAVIERVLKEYPDGRMDLLTVGRRRFEILRLNDERPFLRSAVDFFDDEDSFPAPEEIQRRVLERFEELRGFANETGAEPELDDPQLSFQIAQLVPDLEFRQQMLATRSEADRMEQLAEYLESYIPKQRQTMQARAAAPRNGHSKWPPGM